jgi:hypothetical protein
VFSMFNEIYTDMLCDETGKLSEDSYIQAKWQKYTVLNFEVYNIGNIIPDLLPGYDNVWIKTHFLCNVCLPNIVKNKKRELLEQMPEKLWHVAFAEIRDSRLLRIISKSEFEELGEKYFISDKWN